MADEKIVSNEETDEKIVKSDKAGKGAKPAKKKGPGFFGKIGKFFKDTKGEFSKIVWPTFPTVLRNTGVTLAMCVVLGVLVSVVDLGLSALVNLMLSLG